MDSAAPVRINKEFESEAKVDNLLINLKLNNLIGQFELVIVQVLILLQPANAYLIANYSDLAMEK